MKRALVLVALVLAVVVSGPPPAPAHSEAVRPAQHSTGGGARPAATVASVPEVVDDPCLTGDQSCSTPAPGTAPNLLGQAGRAPAPSASAPTPSHGRASAGDARAGVPAQRPTPPATVAAPPAPPVDASGCRPDEDVDPDSPTGCITRQLPGETTGRAYG